MVSQLKADLTNATPEAQEWWCRVVDEHHSEVPQREAVKVGVTCCGQTTIHTPTGMMCQTCNWKCSTKEMNISHGIESLGLIMTLAPPLETMEYNQDTGIVRITQEAGNKNIFSENV